MAVICNIGSDLKISRFPARLAIHLMRIALGHVNMYLRRMYVSLKAGIENRPDHETTHMIRGGK